MLAIARLAGDDAQPCTAFAISITHALSAFHCVRRRSGGDVLLYFESSAAGGEPVGPVRGRVVDGDVELDLALIELSDRLPSGFEPVEVAKEGATLDGQRFVVTGFGVDRPRGGGPHAFDGTIVRTDAGFRGAPAVQLFSPELAADENPHQFSGAPVLVPLTPGGRKLAVGVVRASREREAAPGRPIGGVVYATPMSAAARRWAVVRDAVARQLITPDSTALDAQGPPLELKILRPRPEVALNFRSRDTPIRGRGSELQLLRRLLSDEPAFAWQLLSGPGGSGKSRLALELCLEASEEGWHAGFLLADSDFSWASWLPARPTLIVIDEVEYRREVATKIIKTLASRAERLTSRVRVLMLGREPSVELENVLGVDPLDWDAFFGDSAAGEPIVLGPLAKADVMQIMADAGFSTSARDLPHEGGALGYPLYAMLAAISGVGLTGVAWDPTLAARYVLARNRASYWRDMSPLDELLLAYACITRDGSMQIKDSGLVVELGSASWSDAVARNHRFTGSSSGNLAALDPGPIGELFVLELLSRVPDPSHTDDVGHRAGEAAFRLNQLANEFVLRVMGHYPEHPGLPRLIAVMSGEFDRATTMPVPMGNSILVQSASEFAGEGRIGLALAEAEALRLLHERGDLDIGTYPESLFGILTTLVDAGDWNDATRVLDLLRAAVVRDPLDYSDGPSALGRATGNYVGEAAAQGEFDRGATAFRNLLESRERIGPEVDPYLASALVDAVKLAPDAASALVVLRHGSESVDAESLRPEPFGNEGAQRLKDAAFNVANRASREGDAEAALGALRVARELHERLGVQLSPQFLAHISIPLGTSVTGASQRTDDAVSRELVDAAQQAPMWNPGERLEVFVGLSNFLTQTQCRSNAIEVLEQMVSLVGTFESSWRPQSACVLRAARLVNDLGASPAQVHAVLARKLDARDLNTASLDALEDEYGADLSFLKT